MLTWLPGVLPLEASALMHFSVNNMPSAILAISDFSTPQRRFLNTQMCKISAPIDNLLYHCMQLIPLKNITNCSSQFPKVHDHDPDLVNHVMHRQVLELLHPVVKTFCQVIVDMITLDGSIKSGHVP